MMLSMGFGAVAFGKRFGLYSITSILILLVFGILTALEGPRLQANLPTPWLGVWERILIGVYLIWVVVLAIVLVREEKKKSLISASVRYKLSEKLTINEQHSGLKQTV